MKVSINKIKPNPDNPRYIKDKQFQTLVKSLEDFPEMADARPLVVNKDYVILGGNMRFKAMLELNWKLIPVMVVDWPEKKQREFVVKDNVSGGEWDWDLLANEWELEELEQWGLELPDVLLRDLDDEGDGNVPPVAKSAPQSKLGEVYALGEHRIMCGDATNSDHVNFLLEGKTVDMVFTDPPYNVDYEGKTKEKLKIDNDKFSNDEFYDFLLDSFKLIFENMKAGGAVYVCHADLEGLNFRRAYVDAGLLLKQCLIWNKNSLVMGRQDYQWKHEPILYGWKPGASHYFIKDRTQTTIWDIDRPTKSEDHPTMKPVDLIVKAIQNSSKEKDLVFDPFLGSGSTLIAADRTDRVCYGMELDPKYCDVIRKRYVEARYGNTEGWIKLTKLKG